MFFSGQWWCECWLCTSRPHYLNKNLPCHPLQVQFIFNDLNALNEHYMNKWRTKKLNSNSSTEIDRGRRSGERMEGYFCACGEQRIIRVSWTRANPGRRFWSCRDPTCNRSFEWVEGPLCARSSRIISGILKNKSELEVELQRCKKRERIMRVVVIVLVIVIIFCCM